jgi:hypothetical protein
MGSPPIASLQVKDSLTNAVNLCLSQLDHYLPRACRDNAERFDATNFRNGLAQIITTALAVLRLTGNVFGRFTNCSFQLRTPLYESTQW